MGRRLFLVLAGALGLSVTLITGATGAAFSSATGNPGNTFTAAASFCGTQTVTASEDARVHQGNPASNYGNDPALQVRSAFLSNRRTLVTFALPAIPPGCTLTSATLRLFATSAAGGRTIDVYRANAAWSEAAVTWVTQPGTTGPAVGAPSGSGWVQWNVTGHVSAMYAGSNFGFVVRDRTENSFSSQQQNYRSSEAGQTSPELVVTFS